MRAVGDVQELEDSGCFVEQCVVIGKDGLRTTQTCFHAGSFRDGNAAGVEVMISAPTRRRPGSASSPKLSMRTSKVTLPPTCVNSTSPIWSSVHEERLRSFPHVDFNYGLGERIQLKFETGWLFAEAPGGGGVKSGLDDSLLGVKWRFLDQERSGVDMSVYPQLQVENSTGSVARGIAEPGPNLFLPVEIGHDFGKIRLVGEVGYQYFHAQENEWVVGVLGALEASDTLELLAEVRSYSEKFLNGGDVILNVGLRRALGSDKLLASAGTGLTNGPETTTFIAYLGVQVLLGEK